MGLNTENRTVNAGKNTVSALANKLCVLFLTFLSRKLFIQYIGVEYLGINGLFSNVLTLLSMADLGIGTAMNVSLYKPIAEKDIKRLTALLHFFKQLYYLIAAGVTVIGIALIPFLPYIINMDSDIPHLYLYYVIFVLKNAVSYLFVYKAAIIRADQKNYIVNRVDIYVKIAQILLQMVAVIIFKQYLIYLLLEVVAVIANNIVLSILADKNYSFIKQKEKLSAEDRKHIFRDIYSLFVYKVSWSLLNGTDNILMSMIVGTIYVGLYSNYSTITNNLEVFIALLFTSLTASVGNLVATAEAKKRFKIFQTMQMISFWICGYVTVSFFYLTQDFIELWLGKDFLLDQLTLIAMVLNLVFSICMRPVWTFREGTGMYRQIRYVMLGTAILNLVLSIAMGYWLGISGILFATSISKLTTYFWYEPYILYKNFFDSDVLSYYLEYLKNIGLILLGGAICYLPVSLLKTVSPFHWLIKACICFVVMNGLYFMAFGRTEQFYFLKDKAMALVKALKRR